MYKSKNKRVFFRKGWKKKGSPKAGGFERCSKTIKQQLVSAALWDIVNKKYTKPKA